MLWRHQQRGKALIALITACSAQGFLLLGYDQGVMSGIIGANNAFGKDFNHPDADLQGDIVALYNVGCAIGSIITYFIADAIGRRRMIILGGCTMIIGTILLGSSYTMAQLITGRIVTGIGNGMNSSTIPVYQGECSPALIRGILLSFNGTTTILGLCIAYWFEFGTSYLSTSVQWRLPLSFQAVFAVCLVLQVIGLPETPRWLAQRDRHEEARQVLSALKDLPEEHPDVILAHLDIQTAIAQESAGGPFKISELWSGGQIQNWRRILLTIILVIMHAWTGSNFLNYYGPSVYRDLVGLGDKQALIVGGGASLTYLVGSCLPLFVVDKYGRRMLLIVCSLGLSLCFTIVTILLSTQKPTLAKASIAFIYLYQFTYGLGWLPVPWFYPAELNVTRVRAKAQAIASGWNWMAVFAVAKVTPITIANISWRSFIIFAVLNCVWAPIIYCFYPETAGLELEDIDLIFAKGGFTGGVFSTRGRTVKKLQHALQNDLLNGKQRELWEHIELPDRADVPEDDRLEAQG